MRKIISLLLIATMLMGILAACGGSGAGNQQQQPNNNNTQTEGSDKQDPTDTQTTPSLENWGELDTKTVRNKNGLLSVFFRWPVTRGYDAHTGKIANQDDGTVVLVDNYAVNQSPEADSIDKVFPAYFEQTAKVFAAFYEGKYSDEKFTIKNTETVTVGEYEFYKYTGEHSYKYSGNQRNTQFVIYLTATKTTGAYIYWLVADVTADQSAWAKVEDHAYKIALSIKEDQ